MLSGYMNELEIPNVELSIIRRSMAARLAQSLTIGWHTYQANPTPANQYVLNTQARGWHLLNELWFTKDDNQIIDHWMRLRTTSNH